MLANQSDFRYLAPNELELTPTPLKRILVIGSCAGHTIAEVIGHMEPGLAVDYVQNNAFGEMPENPPSPVADYDFQIVQILTRYVFNESEYFSLGYGDVDGYQGMFDRSLRWLRSFIDDSLRWNSRCGLLTFVPTFLVPQVNQLGRLLPRYDLRNPAYFFEQLNFYLHDEVGRYKNAHVIDFEQILCSFGKRNTRDDGVWALSHGAFLGDFDEEYDRHRIEPPPRMREHYVQSGYEAFQALWLEVKTAFRTIRQIDSVKLVVIDLDDTLWRGVVAEGVENMGPLEGWPLGFIEAIAFLKKRGILIAIISKNTESVVTEAWQKIVGNLLSIDDFVVYRINWDDKVTNMSQVLNATNLLSRNVVFIDDNPIERNLMKNAYPDMRVIGRYPYLLKRVLLWSAETQVAFVTKESENRTGLVRQQVRREESRQLMTREEFLESLDLKIQFHFITSSSHPRFPRAYELVNKTNQFNSTGRRWKHDDIESLLKEKGEMLVFDVQDSFSNYGLIGVIIMSATDLLQFVMSCRVMSLGVETAALARAVSHLRARGEELRAHVEETPANFLCRDFLRRSGFEPGPHLWTLTKDISVLSPSHIRLTNDPHDL